MMKKITLFIFLLIVSIGYSQKEVVQNFEADGSVGEAFGAIASVKIVTDPADGAANGKVLELISSATGQAWQGVNLNLSKNVDVTTDKTMTIDVYSTAAASILLKVNGGVSGAKESAGEVDHTGSGWETLTITFDKVRDGKSVANGVYENFVIHTNWDTAAVTFQNPPVARTIYIDNIKGLVAGETSGPTPPATAAPTPPTREAANVISFYSDAYTDTTIDNFDYGECTEGVSNLAAEEVMIQGNATQRFLGKGCQGIGFETNRKDASTFTDFHFDFYTDEELDGVVFNIKLVDFAGQETNASSTGLELNFNKGTTPSLVPGKWISLDFDLTAINAPSVMGNLTRSDIAQIHITSNLSNAWYDNLYLYKETLNPGTCSDGVQNQDETGIDCGGVCEPCTGPPTVGAPTPPQRVAADVLSFYSDAYTDVTIDNFDYGQCTGGVSDLAAEEVTIDGNATQRFLGEGCQGIGFEMNRIDASAFTHVHFDFFTDVELDGAVFNLKFVDFAGKETDASSSGLEVIMNAGTSTKLVTGSWVSVDVDITSLGGMVLGNLERSDVAQIHITSNLSNAYYDNLYFHKNTVLSTANFEIAGLEVYPNPSNNSWNVQTENQEISSIRVFDILGKQVVSLSPKSREAKIDGSTLKAGIYFAQIATESGTNSIKLVKK